MPSRPTRVSALALLVLGLAGAAPGASAANATFEVDGIPELAEPGQEYRLKMTVHLGCPRYELGTDSSSLTFDVYPLSKGHVRWESDTRLVNFDRARCQDASYRVAVNNALLVTLFFNAPAFEAADIDVRVRLRTGADAPVMDYEDWTHEFGVTVGPFFRPGVSPWTLPRGVGPGDATSFQIRLQAQANLPVRFDFRLDANASGPLKVDLPNATVLLPPAADELVTVTLSAPGEAATGTELRAKVWVDARPDDPRSNLSYSKDLDFVVQVRGEAVGPGFALAATVGMLAAILHRKRQPPS